MAHTTTVLKTNKETVMKKSELEAQLARLKASKMKCPALQRAIQNLKAMIRGEITYTGSVCKKGDLK